MTTSKKSHNGWIVFYGPFGQAIYSPNIDLWEVCCIGGATWRELDEGKAILFIETGAA